MKKAIHKTFLKQIFDVVVMPFHTRLYAIGGGAIRPG
jgi:hypothetical protein